MTSTNNIDKRMHVGTPAWEAKHDKETQHLSAWRRLHALLPHEEIKRLGLTYNDTTEVLVASVKKIEEIQRKG